MKLQPSEAAAIRDRIMTEMLALEEERMQRMRENREDHSALRIGMTMTNTMEDEGIIRRELNKVDPSAVVFSESWAAKKSRVRQESPYGHLGMCVSNHPLPDSDTPPSQLGLLTGNCQDWWRSPPRATCSSTRSRVQAYLEGGKLSLLGAIVCSFHFAFFGRQI